MNALIALAAGLVFGVGLVVSGMAQPQNVLGFLDIAGDWNPRLAFVMIGAILVAAPAFAYARRTHRTLRGATIALPDRKHITPALVVGAGVFGIGWGLVGLCPGPALVLLGYASAYNYILIFVASLAVGRIVEARLFNKNAAQD